MSMKIGDIVMLLIALPRDTSKRSAPNWVYCAVSLEFAPMSATVTGYGPRKRSAHKDLDLKINGFRTDIFHDVRMGYRRERSGEDTANAARHRTSRAHVRDPTKSLLLILGIVSIEETIAPPGGGVHNIITT